MDIIAALETSVRAIKDWTDRKKANKSETPNGFVIDEKKLYLAKDGVPFTNSEVELPLVATGSDGVYDVISDEEIDAICGTAFETDLAELAQLIGGDAQG